MENSTSNPINETIKSILFVSYRLIFSIGIVGNILMFLVFYRNSLAKLSVSVYFRAMSISNLFININMIRSFNVSTESEYYLANHSVFLCKGFYFVIYAGGAVAAWFLVAADLDRFLMIAYPNRFHFIRKGRFPLYLVIGIIVYNTPFYVPLLFEAKLFDGV